MKKYFIYLNLFLILFIVGTGQSFANKKYRYIKRQHGVVFQGNVPMTIANGFSLDANLSGAYAYNWKGWLEAGPYFDLGLGVNGTAGTGFVINNWATGLMLEYNLIKNRGKRKLIPSVGVSVGADQRNQTIGLSLGAHTSLKAFVAKRTAFISTLSYEFLTPFNGLFSSQAQNISVEMGFSYYFDFY